MIPSGIARRGDTRLPRPGHGRPRPRPRFPALAVVDVDLFNYCLAVRYLVCAESLITFADGPVRRDNVSAAAIEYNATGTAALPIAHRDCVVSYRTSPDGTCATGSVILPTPLQAGVHRVTVTFAPLAHDLTWCDFGFEVKVRVVQGRAQSFSTNWSS
jgi:hypothetical protein